MLDGFLKDVALGLRSLRNSPSFSVVAVVTLAIGIGANGAIFSLADLIIRRPVAQPKIERLAVLTEQSTGSEGKGISPANYRDLRFISKSFEQLAAYEYWSASATRDAQLEEVHGVRVTPNFFATVGVRAALGGTFSGEDEASALNREVIAGLVLALGLAKLLSTLIYGVSAWDAQSFVMIPVLLLVVAFVACYWAARRATRMDPMTTLRWQ
jgi:uncharacterized membrane protein YqjE